MKFYFLVILFFGFLNHSYANPCSRIMLPNSIGIEFGYSLDQVKKHWSGKEKGELILEPKKELVVLKFPKDHLRYNFIVAMVSKHQRVHTIIVEYSNTFIEKLGGTIKTWNSLSSTFTRLYQNYNSVDKSTNNVKLIWEINQAKIVLSAYDKNTIRTAYVCMP